jgi:hypothetical protein
MTSYLIYNRRTYRQWKGSAEEAMFYCSKMHGLEHFYIVIHLETGLAMDPVDVLVKIFHDRREQREKKNV